MNNLDLYIERVNLNIQWIWNSPVKEVFWFSDKKIRTNKLTRELVSEILEMTGEVIKKISNETNNTIEQNTKVDLDEITRLLIWFDNTFNQQNELQKKKIILEDFIKSYVIKWHNPEYFWQYIHTMEPFPKWPILLPKLTDIENKYPQREQAIHRAYKNRYSSN